MEDIDLTRDSILTDDTFLPWELKKERPLLSSLITMDGFLRSSAYPWSVRRKDTSCVLCSTEYLEEECGTTRCACCGRKLLPFDIEFCSECTKYHRRDHQDQWIEESMRGAIFRI